MTGLAGIQRIIPHRYPLLLVDRVTGREAGTWLTAVKAVTAAESCYADVPADSPVEAYAYPTGLLIESWAQSGVLLAVWDRPNPDVLAGAVELAGGIRNIRFHWPVYPGDLVEHRARLVKTLGQTAILEGESRVGTELVMQVGQFVLALRSVNELRPRTAAVAPA
jgi:3-hydroxyacyl-[acyl-carrier-protein] dehydratase